MSLELFIQKLEEDIKNHNEKRSLGDNLTKEEREALQDMRQWKDKIIRPYDKGTGFVIDYTESYKNRVKAELSNPLIYSIVENVDDAILQINNRIKAWIDKYPLEMSPQLHEWVINDKAEFGYFYLNYKTHKPEKNYPGRLITSGCGSPTENLSVWIEYHLKPLMSELSHRLEDCSEFLRKLELYNEKRCAQEDPKPIILCTWDIEAMFPNITNEIGLAVCKELLDKRRVLEPTTNCLIDAILITLEENVAQFDNIVVKQIDGTAMGPHHSCSYADIAIDKVIDQVVNSELNPYKQWIDLWERFRDDIIAAWIGSETDLLKFDYWLNQINSRLKFTLKHSYKEVKKIIIESSMYSKSSDSHSYLLPSSCHPSHVCRNIPVGVMKRIKRNCSGREKCLEGFQEYKQHLLNRSYNVDLIDNAIAKADEISRDVLIGK